MNSIIISKFVSSAELSATHLAAAWNLECQIVLDGHDIPSTSPMDAADTISSLQAAGKGAASPLD